MPYGILLLFLTLFPTAISPAAVYYSLNLEEAGPQDHMDVGERRRLKEHRLRKNWISKCEASTV